MSDNPLEHDNEFQLSFRNPKAGFKALKSGDVYIMVFEMSKEEWEYFTDPNIDRTGMVLEMTGMVTHRASKQPYWEIPRIPATPLQVIDKSEPVKGGMWSQEAGKMCNNSMFQEFLEEEYPSCWVYHYNEEPPIKMLADIAANIMRELLNINSRKELDTDIEARKRFMDMMSNFSRWSLERT